jgi:superfamily II DNA/RNA helicase
LFDERFTRLQLVEAPAERQTLLFTATWPKAVKRIAEKPLGGEGALNLSRNIEGIGVDFRIFRLESKHIVLDIEWD